jgi:hypothetical protein
VDYSFLMGYILPVEGDDLRMKFYVRLLMFSFLPVFSLHAQTAGEMDALLASRSLTYAQAARFVLPAAGEAAADLSAEGAFRTAVSRGWLPKTASAGAAARLDGTALLLMKAFDLRGGFMYRFFPNSRYAYRELVYQQIIQGQVDGSMPLSGEFFFQILGRAMEAAENSGAKKGGGRK